MPRKKKIDPEKLYISKLSDVEIVKFAIKEAKKQYKPFVLVEKLDVGAVYKDGVYYCEVKPVVREGEYVIVKMEIKYEQPVTKAQPYRTGSVMYPTFKFNDYDCYTNLVTNFQKEQNLLWVDLVEKKVKDPEYRSKAEAYNKKAYVLNPLGFISHKECSVFDIEEEKQC